MRRPARYLSALAGVGAMTAAIGIARTFAPIERVSSVYIIAVLFAATKLGRGPAIFASLTSFVLYDFFFTEPYHDLTISDPDEWISLSLFLLTALVVGQVAATERSHAREAEQREREAVLLFDMLRLMTGADLDLALRGLCERVRRELRVDAVGIGLVIGTESHSASCGDGEASALLVRHGDAGVTLMPGVHEPTPTSAGRPRRWIRVVAPGRGKPYELLGTWRRYVVPVRIGELTVGHITLVRDATSASGAHEDRFLAAVATQLALLVQRERLQASATEAEALRRANELKTALLNAVSHELRTPLASILASAESLLQHDVPWTDEDRDQFALAIKQQGERLDTTVGDLLDLSRIEARALRPRKELHDLGSLIRDVAVRFAEATAPDRIALSIADDIPPVPLDEVEIDQVLSKLIENALRYSPAGGEVEVSAGQRADEVLTEVADRGPGIPEAALPHVFEPFYRASVEGRPSGLGLGLAVAKGFVEAHGGRIWVEPRAGGGVRFGFALPLASVDTGASVAVG